MLVQKLPPYIFDSQRYDAFINRISKHNNEKIIKLVSQYDFRIHGILCRECNTILPIYNFQQNKKHKNGINICKCTKCHEKNKCPFQVLLSHMKSSSKKRNHPPPEHTIDDLKNIFQQQKGKCFISGKLMSLKHGDNDPLNMSPERINNSKHYTKENVVLICQKYQIGHRYDFSPEEVRTWLRYEPNNDNFVFDRTVFDKTVTLTPKKYRAVCDGNMKMCFGCNSEMPLENFRAKRSICKVCENSRMKDYYNTPRGFVRKLANSAFQSTKSRSRKRKHNAFDSDCNDVFNLFLSLIIKQGGRCAETQIPFVYETNHKFAPSPDRLDNTKDYINGNVRIIISPLNTPNNK